MEYWNTGPGETKAKKVSQGKNNGFKGILLGLVKSLNH
jgi:hypothetical protein